MDSESSSNLLKLAELLNPPAQKSTPDDDLPKAGSEYKSPYQKNVMPKSLEEFEEQQKNHRAISAMDSRKQPTYCIKYRQALSAEDVFLQMGPKTPSSACCEDMIVSVNLPGEKFPAMDLNLSKSNVNLNGFLYRLDLDLPHSINPDRSSAKWNGDDETLVLTMRIVREFDFVNF